MCHLDVSGAIALCGDELATETADPEGADYPALPQCVHMLAA